MPLTKRGKEILKKFQEQYGRVQGEKFFYASIIAGKLKDKNLHEKGGGRLEKAKKTYQRNKRK